MCKNENCKCGCNNSRRFIENAKIEGLRIINEGKEKIYKYEKREHRHHRGKDRDWGFEGRGIGFGAGWGFGPGYGFGGCCDPCGGRYGRRYRW